MQPAAQPYDDYVMQEELQSQSDTEGSPMKQYWQICSCIARCQSAVSKMPFVLAAACALAPCMDLSNCHQGPQTMQRDSSSLN